MMIAGKQRTVAGLVIILVLLIFHAAETQSVLRAEGGQPVRIKDAPADAELLSQGVYRIPYASGTRVMISADHTNHLAISNKLDMQGAPNRGGYPIVAALDGWIDWIVDSHDTFCPPPPEPEAADPCLNYAGPSAACCVRTDAGCKASCANNGVWVYHANGEYSRYAHLQANSVSALGWQVGDFVLAGDVLGLEGDGGFTTGPHLHFEVAVPNDPDRFLTASGALFDDGDRETVDFNRQNRVPLFCGYGLAARYDFVVAADCRP